jgi:hypothetical protein
VAFRIPIEIRTIFFGEREKKSKKISKEIVFFTGANPTTFEFTATTPAL